MTKNKKIVKDSTTTSKKDQKKILKKIKAVKKKAIKKIKEEKYSAISDIIKEKEIAMASFKKSKHEMGNEVESAESKKEKDRAITSAVKIKNKIDEKDEPVLTTPTSKASNNMKATDAIAQIGSLYKKAEIDIFIDGEKRSTILSAAENRKEQLEKIK